MLPEGKSETVKFSKIVCIRRTPKKFCSHHSVRNSIFLVFINGNLIEEQFVDVHGFVDVVKVREVRHPFLRPQPLLSRHEADVVQGRHAEGVRHII